MTTTFDRPAKTSKNGNEYWQALKSQYDAVNSEVLFIVRNIQGISPEYIENKPVPFRKKLVKDLLDEQQKGSDGSGVVTKKK